MKKFNNLVNKILNEYTEYEDKNMFLILEKMKFCPYFIKNLIKTFKVDIAQLSDAIYGQYHFYYRMQCRSKQYTEIEIKSIIYNCLNKFLTNNYYKRFRREYKEENKSAFTFIDNNYPEIKIKASIYLNNNILKKLNNINDSTIVDYDCILYTILYYDMKDFNNDNKEKFIFINENILPDFLKNNIYQNFNFNINTLLNNNGYFINTIPIIVN